MLNYRLESVIKDLPKQNAKYAMAVAANNRLYEETSDVIEGHTDLRITGGDWEAILEYVESLAEKEGLATECAYFQGYIDCVQLLRFLQFF